MNLDFRNCTVYISARSPFARRVRVTLHEHQIPFMEKAFDVLNPSPELIQINPLARVPALQLKSGQVLIDSDVILQAFYEGSKSPLKPNSAEDYLLACKWSALATGLCEKIVEFYLENLRPGETRDPAVIQEFKNSRDNVLYAFEEVIEGRRNLLRNQLSQADIDMGVALGYLTLRDSDAWQNSYTQCAEFFKHMASRPSFKKTIPPP